MGTIALVCGIIAIIGSFGGSVIDLSWLGCLPAILAIIFGAIGRKDPAQKSNATVGLWLGIISLFWGIVATLACLVCIGAAAGALSTMY